MANQYFNTWSTCIKLAWDLPRATHSYFLEALSGGLITVKWDIITRYAGFYRGLLTSPSREVNIMARLVGKDIRTTTAKNLRVLERETGGSSWRSTSVEIRRLLSMRAEKVANTDQWRLPYLSKLLEQRDALLYNGEGDDSQEVVRVKELLDSLCSS